MSATKVAYVLYPDSLTERVHGREPAQSLQLVIEPDPIRDAPHRSTQLEQENPT